MSVVSISESESDVEFVRSSFPSRSRSPRRQPSPHTIQLDAAAVLPDDLEILYEMFGNNNNVNIMRRFLDTFPGNLRFPDMRRRRFNPPVEPTNRTVSVEGFLSGISVERIESKTAAENLGSCPICLVDYKARMSVRVLSCGHKIHKPCFDAWSKKGGRRFTCPLDNMKLQPD